MANPLQDQLLKAGLVKPRQIKKATKEKRQAQRGNTPDAATEQARLAQQHKAQRAQVISGVLAVVRFDQTYELVPSVTAEKIARRDPGCVLVFNVPSSQGNPQNGPYADYPVPDDLMW